MPESSCRGVVTRQLKGCVWNVKRQEVLPQGGWYRRGGMQAVVESHPQVEWELHEAGITDAMEKLERSMWGVELTRSKSSLRSQDQSFWWHEWSREGHQIGQLRGLCDLEIGQWKETQPRLCDHAGPCKRMWEQLSVTHLFMSMNMNISTSEFRLQLCHWPACATLGKWQDTLQSGLLMCKVNTGCLKEYLGD